MHTDAVTQFFIRGRPENVQAKTVAHDSRQKLGVKLKTLLWMQHRIIA